VRYKQAVLRRDGGELKLRLHRDLVPGGICRVHRKAFFWTCLICTPAPAQRSTCRKEESVLLRTVNQVWIRLRHDVFRSALLSHEKIDRATWAPASSLVTARLVGRGSHDC
jgi:hypothetical protein